MSVLSKVLRLRCCGIWNRFRTADVILSLKGIGTVTAAGLIGEVGDFSKFATISEVMKLAGLDLYEVSSGKHRGKLRISKRGRPLMRKLLYFAALEHCPEGRRDA